MKTYHDSIKIFENVWPYICTECKEVFGSELHYQAIMYRCFRHFGKVPSKQIGMNVKIWINRPITSFFRTHEYYKHKDYQGGVEPTPDIVLFSPEINGDFRRRNYQNSLRHILMAIEVKASERADNRLMPSEITRDIYKLEAFRNEARRRRSNLVPTMVVLDTAPIEQERMTVDALALINETAKECNVGLYYLSQSELLDYPWNIEKLGI